MTLRKRESSQNLELTRTRNAALHSGCWHGQLRRQFRCRVARANLDPHFARVGLPDQILLPNKGFPSGFLEGRSPTREGIDRAAHSGRRLAPLAVDDPDIHLNELARSIQSTGLIQGQQTALLIKVGRPRSKAPWTADSSLWTRRTRSIGT